MSKSKAVAIREEQPTSDTPSTALPADASPLLEELLRTMEHQVICDFCGAHADLSRVPIVMHHRPDCAGFAAGGGAVHRTQEPTNPLISFGDFMEIAEAVIGLNEASLRTFEMFRLGNAAACAHCGQSEVSDRTADDWVDALLVWCDAEAATDQPGTKSVAVH